MIEGDQNGDRDESGRGDSEARDRSRGDQAEGGVGGVQEVLRVEEPAAERDDGPARVEEEAAVTSDFKPPIEYIVEVPAGALDVRVTVGGVQYVPVSDAPDCSDCGYMKVIEDLERKLIEVTRSDDAAKPLTPGEVRHESITTEQFTESKKTVDEADRMITSTDMPPLEREIRNLMDRIEQTAIYLAREYVRTDKPADKNKSQVYDQMHKELQMVLNLAIAGRRVL